MAWRAARYAELEAGDVDADVAKTDASRDPTGREQVRKEIAYVHTKAERLREVYPCW